MSFIVPDTIEMAPGTDFVLRSHGAICLLQPLSKGGKAWFDKHIPAEATRWDTSAVAIEPRNVEHVLIVIAADGLAVAGHYDVIN